MDKRKLETVKEIISVINHAIDIAIDEEDRFEMMVKEWEENNGYELRGEENVVTN